MSKLEEVAQAVEGGKLKIVAGLVEEALAEGIDPLTILNDGMIVTMGIVGNKFRDGEIFVPEMLIAAKAMKKGVEVLKPRLSSQAGVSLGKCIIGTVAGDMHDIGKNLVSMMIESAGFEVIDLGVDVAPERFVEALKQNPDTKILALSALLTTTMPAMKTAIEVVAASGLKGFKIIVGGAPITQEYADQIGADGYSADAGGAAALAKRLAA
ncbi:MAG: corrinoid protein [Treponema sp.]|jgi:corrinoid protein of di/trimethylamine methyltransferase|nr:corrinoid protein [Treponema sp.]